MTTFDLVIRNGRLVTPADVFPTHLGIKDGRIVAIAAELASGRLPDGAEICDGLFTGSRSAACGGTTTIIPFGTAASACSITRRFPVPADTLPSRTSSASTTSCSTQSATTGGKPIRPS